MQDFYRRRTGLLLLAAAVLQGCGGGHRQSTPPPPATYTVGGTLSGVSGSGLTLQLNGSLDLALSANGTFAFSTALQSGATYTITIKAQPTSPPQTCVLSNASGSVAGSNITNVAVACTNNSYAVGGTVNGLAGSGLILQINGGGDLPVTKTGAFQFGGHVVTGVAYAVTVKTQPATPYQTCVITNANGTIGAADISNVTVDCSTNSYSVGGTVTGLTGSGLVLQVNGGQDLPIGAAGAFQFPAKLASGSSYSVTVKNQTATFREICAASNSSGTVAASDIGTVNIDCDVAEGFVYLNAHQKIVGYAIHSQTGALIPLNMPPTAGIGTRGGAFVASPTGTMLYATDYLADTISAYAVDSSKGTLSTVGTPLPFGDSTGMGAEFIAITPSGKFLYAGNRDTGDIALFSINAVTGALTAQGMAAQGSRGYVFAMTPDGKFLYALDPSMGTPSTLTHYAIDSTTGALTGGATVALVSETDPSLHIDPLGRFLYTGLTEIGDNDYQTILQPYSIDSGTGAVTAVGTGSTIPHNNDGPLAIDPTGRYAYLLDNFTIMYGPMHISQLAIDQTTGAITSVGSLIFIDAQISTLICDASGKFLFVGAVGPYPGAPSSLTYPWYDVSGYSIGASGPTAGLLTPAGLGTTHTGSLMGGAQVAVIE